MHLYDISILNWWKRIEHVPFRGRLLGRFIGLVVPYTGSIQPQILELAPGYAKTSLQDKRKLRNHLNSVHAIALTNLAELTASAAMMTRQPPKSRWIVRSIQVEFLKKARGQVVAECRVPELDWAESKDVAGRVAVYDASAELVAEVKVGWRIGPAR